MRAMPIRVRVTATLLAMAALALTGCDADDDAPSAASAGSSSAPPPAASTPNKAAGSLPDDVCALLTKEEAGELLQKKVTKVRAENSGTERSCSYDDLNIVLTPTTEADFRAEAEHALEQVPGIGNAAYAGGTALFVLHDTTRITITSGGGTELRTAIARKVITNLESQPTPTP